MSGTIGTPAQKKRRVSNAGGSQLKSTTKKAATPAREPVVDSRFAMGADFEEDDSASPSGATLNSLSREPVSNNQEPEASAKAHSSPAQLPPIAPSPHSPSISASQPAGTEQHSDEDEDGKADAQPKQTAPGETAATDGSKRLRTGSKKQVLSEAKLKRMQMIHDRRGIVYISRIPPHMKPMKLKQLLEQYGEVGRVYCAPEDAALRRMRKKQGGNTGKNFTEGWVEFEDKRVAKRTAQMLNGQQMGGKRRSAYHYDLWTLKYLSKFKWDHLTEEINYQKATREQKLITEISAAKRERDFYLSRVDKAKGMDAMAERRKKIAAAGGAPGASAAADAAGGSSGAAGGSSSAGAAAPSSSQPHSSSSGSAAAAAGGDGAAAAPSDARPRFVRHFGQRQARLDPVNDVLAPQLSSEVLGMLGRKRARVALQG